MLRQKVSMPLDRLVQPISLAEWRNAATIAPQVSTVTARQSAGVLPSPIGATPEVEATKQASTAAPTDESATNPFADDPAPQPEGKIPSGKLMGIVGRALFESAPVPSLEGLREKLPNVPVPVGGAAPPAAEDEFGAGPSFNPTDESDPFSEPAADPAAEDSNSEATTPEEDPFG